MQEIRYKMHIFELTYPKRSSVGVLGSIQPRTQWVPGALYPRVKPPGRKADHSPPSSAELRMRGAIPPIPHASSWRGA